MPPARLIALIARMWWRWPPEHRRAGFEVDAERRAEERELGVVDREGVARRAGRRRSRARMSSVKYADAAGVDRRPARRRRRFARPPRLRVAHHRRDPRDAGLDAPLRRHLVGHEREVAALAVAELGRDADARASPQTTRSPSLDVAQLAARGARRPSTTITASMRWRSTSIQRPSTRTSVRWLVVE